MNVKNSMNTAEPTDWFYRAKFALVISYLSAMVLAMVGVVAALFIPGAGWVNGWVIGLFLYGIAGTALMSFFNKPAGR